MDGIKTQTLTGLKRWSCQDMQLPSVDQIRAIHIYDFDNTLFASPLPNKQVWAGPSIGTLQGLEMFSTGGWWHDVNILASTGKGAEEEEKTAWQGWWNESIVELVRLSMQQKDAVCVLLTGRNEKAFAPLVSRMIAAKGLGFDMVCLKPAVSPSGQTPSSTMAFKQELLGDLVSTYTHAEDVKMYEDRPKHTAAFRHFFATMNRNLQASQSPDTRPPFAYEVVQVTEQATTLDTVTEIAEVQRMINTHNSAILAGTIPPTSRRIPLAITRTVFSTAYLIAPQDTERLLPLANLPTTSSDGLKVLANSILICPRPASVSIMQRVGGMGRSVRFRVTHTAVLENKFWAVRVIPTDPTLSIYTENPVPLVILAHKKNARTVDATRIRQNMWHPVAAHQMIEFETTVGERMQLKIDEEKRGQDAWAAAFPSDDFAHLQPNHGNSLNARNNGSFIARDEDFPALGSSAINTRNENDRPIQNVEPKNMQSVPTGPRPQNNNRRDRDRDHGNVQSFGGVQKGSQRGGGRGGRGGSRGGVRGNGRGGGRGGGRRGGQYRSLDDSVGNGSYGGGGMQY